MKFLGWLFFFCIIFLVFFCFNFIETVRADDDYETYLYTVVDIIFFSYYDDTTFYIYNETDVLLYTDTLDDGEQFYGTTDEGVYKIVADKKFSVLGGDPITHNVMGYYAMDENGYGLSEKLYTYMPSDYSTNRFIVFSYEDNTHVTITNIDTSTLFFDDVLMEGEHFATTTQTDCFILVEADKPVSALSYDDQGYFCPSKNKLFSGTTFYTYSGNVGGWPNSLHVYVYDNDTHVTITNTIDSTLYVDGIANATDVITVNSPYTEERYYTIIADKDVTVSVNPIGGGYTSYYHHGTYVADKSGACIGTDFLSYACDHDTGSHFVIMAFENETQVDVYNVTGDCYAFSVNISRGEIYDLENDVDWVDFGVWHIVSNNLIALYEGWGDAQGSFAPTYFGSAVFNPPVITDFDVDTEPGANSGWDFDNNDVQIDYSFYHPNSLNCTLLWTFGLGSLPSVPTNTSYNARRDLRTNETVTNYDLNWASGVWEDYDGTVYIYMRVWDGTFYSNVSLATLSNGIDGTAPVTNVISLDFFDNVDRSLICAYSDPTSGIYNISLYYAYSADNGSFSSYSYFDVDTVAPYVFMFNHPNGQGFYKVYCVGWDKAGNSEAAPVSEDQRICYVTDALRSGITPMSFYRSSNTDIVITVPVNNWSVPVYSIRLYYKYSFDNVTFSEFSFFKVDFSDPYSITFDFPDGVGYYYFSSVCTDEPGNVEDVNEEYGDILLYYNASMGWETPQEQIVSNLGMSLGDIILLIVTCSLFVVGAFDIRIGAMFGSLMYSITYILYYQATSFGYVGFNCDRVGILVIISIVILALLVLSSGKAKYRYYIP